MTYEDGKIYEGEWKDNKRHGNGKLVFPNGASYEGEWKDDEIEGYGTVLWQDGGKYVGYFEDSQRHGKGTSYNADGIKMYEGDHKYGKEDGYGTVFSDKGEIKYKGEWKKGEFHGQGIYTEKDESDGSVIVLKGEFKEQKFFNGIFTRIKPDGTQYIAEVKNGNKDREKRQKQK